MRWVAGSLALSSLSCAPDGPSERGLGVDIDAVLDLPGPHGGTPGADGPCSEACLLGPTVPGDQLVASPADIEALAGVRCVYGQLVIAGSGFTTLAGLEGLESVCGSIVIEGSADLRDTSGLDGLTREAPITVHATANPVLSRLSFPYAEGLFTATDNPALAEIGLGGLENGWISISESPSLQRLRLPRLASGTLILRGNANLSAVELPVLETAASITVEASHAMVGLPQMPLLQHAEAMSLVGNEVLTSLDGLLELVAIDRLVITWNPSLDQAYAEDVAGQVAAWTKVAGNAGWVTPEICPFDSDAMCDAIGCGGTDLCMAGSDFQDCCDMNCYPECPHHGG